MKNIILTVDFLDCNDWMNDIYEKGYGHRAAHVGLRSEWFEYIFPLENKPLKIRESGVIYYHFKVLHAIHLVGQIENDDWLDQFEGRRVDSRFWRLITEPYFMLADAGLNLHLPKRTICIDIIADILRTAGVETRKRTVHGFYTELLTHPLRIG